MIPDAAHASESIRVGNGAGFWGDNLDAPYLLARDGRIDVLTLEYLAELTMAILSHLRSKDPTAGFVTDFPELVERLAPILVEKAGLRIVTNAGGLNPPSCAARCGEILEIGGPGETADRRRHGRRRPGLDPRVDRRRGSTCRTWKPASRSRAWPRGWWRPTSTSGRRPIAEALAIGRAIRGDRPGRRCLADPRARRRLISAGGGTTGTSSPVPRPPAT